MSGIVVKSDCSGCPLYEAKEHKGDTVSVELTRAELNWLLIAVLINPWSNIKNLTIGNRIYAKLEKLDK